MENILIILIAIAGTTTAYFISIYLNKGPTMGAAVTTLLSGIVFSYMDSELGLTLAVVATTGAYAGMISKKKAPRIWEMIIIGFIVGTISILATSTYVGVGGKLGTIAAISCLSWIGMKKAFNIEIVKETDDAKKKGSLKKGIQSY